MSDPATAMPFAAQRLLLDNVLVELEALSSQGYGGATINGGAVGPGASIGPDPNDPTSILWPSDDYQTIGDAWSTIVNSSAFGGSTSVTTGTPLALTVDQAVADIQSMNAWLDSYQGAVPGSSFPFLAWLTAIAAGAGVAYGLVRWRNG